MRSLESLIRLYKFQLDDKKRRLADVRELSQQIGLSLTQLEEEITREQALVQQDTLTHGKTFASYRQQVEQRRTSLLASISRLEEEITHINDEIAASFQELKRYETAEEERQRFQQAKRTRLDNAFADEIALQRSATAANGRRR